MTAWFVGEHFDIQSPKILFVGKTARGVPGDEVFYPQLGVKLCSMAGGGKINHIPIRTAAEAVVTPIQLHAWGFIVMERVASHPVPTYTDSIMLRSLSGCDGLLHSFKYIQIYPSLKKKKST